MSNKEKYEGKTVEVYSPFGRKLDTLLVIEVINEHCIYGESKTKKDFETAYDLNDGITVKVVE